MSKYIIYLEPDHGSDLHQRVNHFLKSSAERFFPTTAAKYQCHASMTGYFDASTDDCNVMIEKLTSILSTTVLSDAQLPKVHEPILVLSKLNCQPTHLLLPLTVPDSYHRAVLQFTEAMQTSLGILIRPKSIDHISLGYWDEPNATAEQEQAYRRDATLLERMYAAATSELGSLHPPLAWQIVLYERAIKETPVGEPHVFVTKGRWTVPV